jgi:hypothetical protein
LLPLVAWECIVPDVKMLEHETNKMTRHNLLSH